MENDRRGADRFRVLDTDGTQIARPERCPGVHGETTAAPDDGGDVVVAGCAQAPGSSSSYLR